MANAKRRYSVVYNPGMDDEKTMEADLTYDRAFIVLDGFRRNNKGDKFDVMLQRADGTLTSDF